MEPPVYTSYAYHVKWLHKDVMLSPWSTVMKLKLEEPKILGNKRL